jgi:hypothetical protein
VAISLARQPSFAVGAEGELVREAAADSGATAKLLEGENLNLRIDNRAKVQAINFLSAQNWRPVANWFIVCL